MGVSIGEPVIERIPCVQAPVEPCVVPAMCYRAELVSTSEALLALEPKWRELLRATGEISLGLHDGWLREWWRCFANKRPFVILVFNQQQQLAAVAPFQISSRESGILTRGLRKLQFAGTEPDIYDWMKILVRPDEDELLILSKVADKLRQEGSQWDVIDLRFCKDKSQLEALGIRLGGHFSWRGTSAAAAISEPMTIPYLDLPDSLEGYRVDCHKKSYRADLRRIRNHIQRDFGDDGLELVFLPPSEASVSELDEFLACHRRYWAQKGQKTQAGRHPELAEFYRRVYQAMGKPGQQDLQFCFSILKANGKPMSYHIDILHEGGCMGYLACYNPEFKKYRPGILHIEALIEHTIRLGGKRFEFGRGDASYKNQWHIRKMPLWNLLLFKSRWASLLWQGDEALKRLKSGLFMDRRAVPDDSREMADHV